MYRMKVVIEIDLISEQASFYHILNDCFGGSGLWCAFPSNRVLLGGIFYELEHFTQWAAD